MGPWHKYFYSVTYCLFAAKIAFWKHYQAVLINVCTHARNELVASERETTSLQWTKLLSSDY